MLQSRCHRKKFPILLTLLLVVLSGCGNTIGNPTPKDFLADDNADIFLFDSIVYSNVKDVDWVKELDYTIGEEIGEITKQTDKANYFGNGTSNKLPVGTKIYNTNTQIYIAIVDDKEIPYLKMLEG